LRIQEFEITQGAGGLSVNGDIDLGAPLQWRLVATAKALDPSVILHAWPGSLDFELRSTGQWPESGPRARFELPRLSGRLRGRPITGTGDVSLPPDRKPEGRIELRSGGASLVALASRGAQPRVDATLSIANLQDWHSDLQGAIDLEVVARGRVPELQIDATLQARELRQGRNQIGQATLRLSGRDTRTPQGTAELTASAVTLGGFEFDRATVKLEGAARAHTLALDAQGEQLTLRMQADGAYAKESWTGSVGRLALEAQNAPALALLEPAPLSITPQGFALGRSCMKGGDIQVCAAARHQRRELAVEYSIEALPLDVLAAIFAPGSDVTIEGMLEGRGNLRRAANGTLDGRATLGSSSGAFVQGADKDALRLEYRDLGMDIDLDGGAARAHLRGELLKQGPLRGSLSVAMTEADPSLHGSAGITLRDLEPLGWWVPQLANLKGSGEVSAELAGTLGAPRLAFTVKADGLDAEVPLLGLHLREGSVHAGLNPEGGFEAQGSIASGEGLLRLSGARDASRNLALRFSGSNLLAANIPGARVTIAPDLDLTGRLGELDLGGTVKIETAEVNLEKLSLSKSHRPSADVIVVDREVRVKDHAPGLRTDVRILFGDAVKLAGFGLDATVSGELQILEERGQPGRAHGEIRLAGTYEAFGRKLTIERGRLQFAGTSLDDPQLDILAARKIDDVTAKLQVTGSAQKPRLDVFTDPAMSQTDAMSYLLTGKPASDLHGEEGANVQSAAQSVGSVLGNRLAKRLGGKMGFIDEVGVEQNTDLGGSAFTVGKYLSPKLFVSYGVGLFEPGSATTVRYEFTDHWSMEANDTPDDSHAGVRYRIEK
jgi:translocation and assembly module TamB